MNRRRKLNPPSFDPLIVPPSQQCCVKRRLLVKEWRGVFENGSWPSRQGSRNLPSALHVRSQSPDFAVDSLLLENKISALDAFLEDSKSYFAKTKWNRRPKHGRMRVCVRVHICVCVSRADILHFLDLRPNFSLADTLLLRLNYFVILPVKRWCQRPLSSSDQTLRLDPVERSLVFLLLCTPGMEQNVCCGTVGRNQGGESGRH